MSSYLMKRRPVAAPTYAATKVCRFVSSTSSHRRRHSIALNPPIVVPIAMPHCTACSEKKCEKERGTTVRRVYWLLRPWMAPMSQKKLLIVSRNPNPAAKFRANVDKALKLHVPGWRQRQRWHTSRTLESVWWPSLRQDQLLELLEPQLYGGNSHSHRR